MMIRRRSVERLPLDPIPVAAAEERDLGAVCAAAARAAATERDTAASARAGANAAAAERDAAAWARAGVNATSALDLVAVCAAASRAAATERDTAASARTGANATSAYDQGAARTATVNELGMDSFCALVANRTLDLGAARASMAEPGAAVAVRAARGALCARITITSRTSINNV